MPIIVSVFPTRPAVAFDKVHLRELKIVLTEDTPSKAQVRIAFSLFGYDANGDKQLEKRIRTVSVEDAFVEAATRAAGGDTSLAVALNSIESAIAALLTGGEFGEVTKT